MESKQLQVQFSYIHHVCINELPIGQTGRSFDLE